MRQIRQTLRLHLEAGLSYAQVARAIPMARATVGKIVLLARAAGVDWALAQTLSDEELAALRKKKPDAERPYKAWGYPVVPAIYILLAAAIAVDLLVFKTGYTFPGLVIVLLGIPVYFIRKRLAGEAAVPGAAESASRCSVDSATKSAR